MKKLPLFVNGLFLLLCACGQAHADFLYIRVGNGTPNEYIVNGADISVTIPVYAYDSDPSGSPISSSSYQLAFQVNGTGNGIPGFLTFPSGIGSTSPPNGETTIENFTNGALFGRGNGYFTSNPGEVDAGASGQDFLVGNSGNPTPISGDVNSPTKLFDFIFTIKANAVGGDYSLSFVPGAVDTANFSANAFGGVSGSTTLAVDTSNQYFNTFKIITAVPEPSSLALVGLVSVGICLARRRRASV